MTGALNGRGDAKTLQPTSGPTTYSCVGAVSIVVSGLRRSIGISSANGTCVRFRVQPTVLDGIRRLVNPYGGSCMQISRTAALVITACLALVTTVAVAQESSTAKKETTVKGCLSGPNAEGAYVLKTAKGHRFEVGGNDQL